MKKLLIKNAEIVNEGEVFKGSVLISGELIETIYRGKESVPGSGNIETIDADGKLLLPGIIDDQVHFREPGLSHKGDIYTESRAAAAGGVTSFMEMPNTIPQTITASALAAKRTIAAASSPLNYSFYFGATNDNIEEIKAINPEEVCGLKVFMGSSTGNMLVDNKESLRKIFRSSPVLVACHCEDEKTIKNNLRAYIEEYGEDIPVEYHPLIRSREACFLLSSYAVSLAREYGTRLHILHISTAEELGLFDSTLPLKEKKITAEVCIHHLWFDESDYRDWGNFIKWNPAIKKSTDRQALIEGVLSNKIDIVATDHAPHTLKEKQNIYTKASSGGPMVQHSLTAMLELWHRGYIGLEKIVEKMCHNPAILFGIENRGFIREGYNADLCLVDPENNWTVSGENILYKCGWSPFEGVSFNSKVIRTIVNGNTVWDGEEIYDSQPGQLLKFKRLL
jgi:dihydroorotase